MATGIPLLDSIISGASQAVSSVSSFLSTASQSIAQTTQQAQGQLQSFVSGISSTIGSALPVIQQQIIPTTYQQPVPTAIQYPAGYYPTMQYPQTQQIYLPTIQQVQAPSSFTLPGFDLTAILKSLSSLGQPQLDFNTVYNGINSFFQNLPQIMSLIQNPLQNPVTAQLVSLIQNLTNQQTQTVNYIGELVRTIESKLYQSASNTVASIGIDVGQWSNVIDATVRTLMTQLGYDPLTALNNIRDFVNAGYAQQNKEINATQIQLGSFIQQFDAMISGIDDRVTKLSQQIGAPVPPPQKDLIQQAIDSAGSELQRVLIATIEDAQKNPNNFFNMLGTRVDRISEVIDNLKQNKYKSSEQFFSDLFGNDTSAGLARALIILASVIPTLINAVNLAGTPALEAFGYLVNQDNPVKLLGLGEYINAYFKNQIQYGFLRDKAAKNGISEAELRILLNQAKEEPPRDIMISAHRRNFITDEQWTNYLDDQRITREYHETYDKVLHEIPGPSDLTRIADKRVWGLNTLPKYGQYAELPDEYIKQMSYWGFDEQYTKWLWAAHWQLPSPNQIFEMAHRGLLEPGDKETYLGLTDWLPYFRDKLFDITFNVLTRVDVRRLYKQGLLSDSELHQQHLKMGYTEDDARKLDAYTKQTQLPEDETDYTALEKRVKNAVEKGYSTGRIDRNEAISMLDYLGQSPQLSEQELNILDFEASINNIEPTQKSLQAGTVSVVRTAYKKGNLSRQDAEAYLMASGYGQKEADQELYFLDLDNTVRLKSMAQDTAQKLFAAYEIDDVEFHNRLNALGFSAREVELGYQEALLMRDNRTKKLTPTQLQKLFKIGVITIDEYANELKGLGYTDQSVYWLVSQDLTPE